MEAVTEKSVAVFLCLYKSGLLRAFALPQSSKQDLASTLSCYSSIMLVAPHVRTALHVNMTACSAARRWTYTQMLQNY